MNGGGADLRFADSKKTPMEYIVMAEERERWTPVADGGA